MNPIQKIITRISTAAFLLVYALPALAIDTGLKETGKAAGFGETPTDITVVVGRGISAALGLLGIIFLVLVVYGGFLWMTASGNEQQIEKAKKLLISAVIGLAIVSAGYAIASFVVDSLTTATTGT